MENSVSFQVSTLKTAVKAVAVLGPGWTRLFGLFTISMLATVFEGFGLGMMLPVAEVLQKGGEIGAAMTEQGYWRYLNETAKWFGVPLTLSTLLLASLTLFLLRNVLLYLRTIAISRSVQGTIRRNRVRGFELYLHADSGYQDRMSVGRLANDLTVQAGTSAGAVHGLVTLAHVCFMALYYLCFLLLLSWQMTLSILGVILTAFVCIRPFARYAKIVGHRLVQANQAASSFLVECLGAARLIRLARMERAEIDEMRNRSQAQAAGEVAIVRYSAGTSIVMESFVIACGLALLFFGTTVLKLDFATIGLALVILLRQLPVAKEFVVARQGIISNMPSAAHLIALFDEMAAAAEPKDGWREISSIESGITLDDVTYHYDSNYQPALSGVSLAFPARRMTALVGPSGGGKSTLIDLLPRLRDPTSGTVHFDGVPANEFKRSALRTLIAYTPQAPQIFNVTVAAHIRYGKPAATDAEVREAARLAGADMFIEQLPNGFKTLVGEKGVRLSGGQRQRIDLARALVSGADVLILDEPTSNVDAETEHNFQITLQQIRAESGRTIIVVGHRLSTVRNADQIVVIINGRVVESGNHQELLKNNGWYARAFRMQSQGLSVAEANG